MKQVQILDADKEMFGDSTKKRILFDMTVYQTGTTFHGGGEYSYTILKSLLEQKSDEVQVDVFVGDRGRTDQEVLDRCRQAGINVLFCRNAAELSKAVTEGKYNTLYSALPTAKYFEGLVLPEDVLMIITLHGLRKLELREGGMYTYFADRGRYKKDLKEILNRLLNRGKYMDQLKKEYDYLLGITDHYLVVTDSYHSLYNTLRYFPQIGRERIRMYYAPGKLAVKIDDSQYEESVLKEYGVVSGQFGLIISANRMEKNPLRSIMAWDSVYEDCAGFLPREFKTVVLGADHPEKFTRHIRNKDRFIFKGYVEDKELETLYKHTHLLVFASLNEGFGYPPMEAMKYGTLVAASVNTSIPESCGNAALMFNPLIVSEIANRILQSFDPEVRSAKASEIPKQFTKILERQDEDLDKIVNMILTED